MCGVEKSLKLSSEVNSGAPNRAAVQQHLHVQRHVFGRRRDRSCRKINRQIARGRQRAAARIGSVVVQRHIALRNARTHRTRDRGRGIGHARRPQDALGHGRRPRPPIKPFDQASQYIVAPIAVMEFRTRLECLTGPPLRGTGKQGASSGMPPVCVNRWWTRMSPKSVSIASHGRYRRIGACRSTLPSSRICRSVIATKDLVIEPISNKCEVETGILAAMSTNP